MIDPQTITEAKRALGRQLAALREAAGKTQQQLAHQINYGRSTIANAETGYSTCRRTFWEHADQTLHADGALLAGYDDLQVLSRAQRMQVAELSGMKRVAKFRELHGQQLVPAPDVEILADSVLRPPAVVPSAEAHRAEAAPDDHDGMIVQAARDAEAELLVLAEQTDPAVIDTLAQEAATLARAGRRTATGTFISARRIHDQARRLAGHARHPGQLSDLYLVAGEATALMASSAFDLGHWDASAMLARLATEYAAAAGHASLGAWTLGLRATLANWQNEPDGALEYFYRGMAIAPRGAPRFRLRHIASRSYALLGDADAIRAVLDTARTDREQAEDRPDALDRQVGGEFAFTDARAAACAASAWLDVEDGARAEEAASEALTSLTSLPRPRQPLSQLNGARVDVASARLLTGNRDGAEELLREVLALQPRMRNVSLSGRMAKVRKILLTPCWQGDQTAASMAEAIGAWLSETSLRPRLP
jgi:hypothetical protein